MCMDEIKTVKYLNLYYHTTNVTEEIICKTKTSLEQVPKNHRENKQRGKGEKLAVSK